MKNFINRNKVGVIISVFTIVIVCGGTLLLNSANNSNSPQSTNFVASATTAPGSKLIGKYNISGFVNGQYLPATTSAKITIVEFGDYECPACAEYVPYVTKILTDYAGKINYTFKNYPIPSHTTSLTAAYAVEAAGLQGKYWDMHEKVYATQSSWDTLKDPTSVFVGYAKDFGLNMDQFNADMFSKTVKDIVGEDFNDGNDVKLTETPTFYINGNKVALTNDFGHLENVVKEELSK